MIVTLESLLYENDIVEDITSEDVNVLLADCKMECADMLCEMNTYEAASIVCEASNDKNIFKQMIAKVKAAIKWIKDTWVNKIWPKIKAFFQKIFKGKKVDEKKAEEAISQAMKDDPQVESTVEKIIPVDDMKEMADELKKDVSSNETPVERKARKRNKPSKNRSSKNEADPADAAYAVSHSDEYYTIGDVVKSLAEKKQKKLESEIVEAEKKLDSASDEEVVEIKETISALNEEVSETVKVANEITASMTATAKCYELVERYGLDNHVEINTTVTLDVLDTLVNDLSKKASPESDLATVSWHITKEGRNELSDDGMHVIFIRFYGSFGHDSEGRGRFTLHVKNVDKDLEKLLNNKRRIVYNEDGGKWIREQ